LDWTLKNFGNNLSGAMKKHFAILTLAIVGFGLMPAYSQFGAAPGGFQFGGAMSKLFGNNQTFTADLEMQTKDSSGDAIALPGKVTFDSNKSRFEVDMTQFQSAQMPPESAEQMRYMDMKHIVIIRRPDQNATYMIYPGMQTYLENALQNPETAAAADDFKVETTELGKETVDGHPCVKSKVVVTGKDGTKHEFTIWNAVDLKNFPVKIYQAEQGNESTMTLTFKNIAFTKPAASLFDPPSDYTRYDSMRSMIQSVMFKHMDGDGNSSPLAH
jgi:hypothetical protein